MRTGKAIHDKSGSVIQGWVFETEFSGDGRVSGWVVRPGNDEPGSGIDVSVHYGWRVEYDPEPLPKDAGWYYNEDEPDTLYVCVPSECGRQWYQHHHYTAIRVTHDFMEQRMPLRKLNR